MDKKIYRVISSMKTGMLLLGLIALTSALGSAVNPKAFFKTIVFELMLFLLLLNMALCTANRVICFKRVYFKHGHVRQGWPRQIGIILLHAGMILILVGGIVFAYCGQNSEFSITEGQTVDISSVVRTQEPFSLYLEKFSIKFNENGSPSQYYSIVNVLEDGLVKATESISVNHPFKYKGIKTYQDSFGYLVKVKYLGEDCKEIETLSHEGEFIKLPGTQRVVKVYGYFPDFDPGKGMNQTSLKPDNPRIVYSVYENDKLLGVGVAKFGEKIEIDANTYVVFTGVERYTVLKVKSDPGMSLAFAGSLMFMLGVSLTLFLKL
jgi:cytochrome c biogenesis protein